MGSHRDGRARAVKSTAPLAAMLVGALVVVAVAGMWRQALDASCAADGPCPRPLAHAAQRVLQMVAEGPPASLMPVSGAEVAMFAVVAVVLFLAAGAGVGGGPILMPTYMLLGGLTTVYAVALSNVTILCGSVANTALNVFKRHPFRERPLINYDLILLMQPPTSIGAVYGSFINKVMPQWLSQTLLLCLLVLLTWRMTQRAAQIHRRENRAAAAAAAEAAALRLALPATATATASATATAAEHAHSSQTRLQGQAGAKAAAALQRCDGATTQLAGSADEQLAVRKVPRLMSEDSACDERIPAGAVPLDGALRVDAARRSSSCAGSSGGCNGSSSRSSGASSPRDAACHLGLHSTAALEPEPAAAAACAAGDGSSTASAPLPPPSQLTASPPRMSDGGSADLPPHALSINTFASQVLLSMDLEGGRTPNARDLLPTDPAESQLAYALPADQAADGDADPTGAAAKAGAEPRLDGLVSPLPEVPTGLCQAEELVLAGRLAQEARQVPLMHVALMLAMLASTLMASLLSKLATQCGTWQWWAAVSMQVPVLLGIWASMRRRVLQTQSLKSRAGMDTAGELRWTPINTLTFPAVCTLGGLIAGMFGLGGAVVITPLMLELGVHPQVTSATTQTMLLITTASATVVYAQMGDVLWDYAAVLAVIALLATLVGQVAIDRVVKHFGRASLLVILLAVFFGVATALAAFLVVKDVVQVVRDPALLTAVAGICPHTA